MDKFVIEGGPFKVSGEYAVSGSKNACLPILASSLLFDKSVEIKNLANVKDVNTILTLLQSLGKKIVLSKNIKDTVKNHLLLIYSRRKRKSSEVINSQKKNSNIYRGYFPSSVNGKEGLDIGDPKLNKFVNKIFFRDLS